MKRVLVLRQAELFVDDELDGHGAAHTVFRGRCDGLVVRIGVQRVAVVVDGVKRLQRGTDVVEIDFLRVQRTARRLDVVLEHLGACGCPVLLAHSFGPDAPGHAADDCILWIDAVGEEKAEIRPKLVQVHASAQVVLDVGKTVSKGKGQLRDRIGAGFGDVVPTDGYAVEVADGAVNERGLHITHQPQGKLRRENARVLGLVLLQNVRLNRTACLAHGLCLQPGVHLGGQYLIARASQQQQAQTIVSLGQVAEVGRAFQPLVFPFGF